MSIRLWKAITHPLDQYIANLLKFILSSQFDLKYSALVAVPKFRIKYIISYGEKKKFLIPNFCLIFALTSCIILTVGEHKWCFRLFNNQLLMLEGFIFFSIKTCRCRPLWI